MATTSNRSINIQFENDVEYNQTFDAAESLVSPGSIETIELVAGNNTITVPDNAVSATIIPPSANEETLTLKGVNGDTGIGLARISPTSIGLASGVTSFVIAAGDDMTIRIVWA